MPGEEEIEIPDAWRCVVHPRRQGMAALEPAGGWPERMPWYTAFRPEYQGMSADEAGSALRPVHGLIAGYGLAGAAALFAPRQTIIEITFASAEGELGVFSDLPLITRSELIRSLRTLD
jgi:hypothetical protein